MASGHSGPACKSALTMPNRLAQTATRPLSALRGLAASTPAPLQEQVGYALWNCTVFVMAQTAQTVCKVLPLIRYGHSFYLENVTI